MRFQVGRSALEDLDDEIIVQEIALPIGDQTRRPESGFWSAYSANPHLREAQINIVLIGEVLVEVLNGGLFQLIMNPSGALIPDLPHAFRAIGRPEEANILSNVLALFPNEGIVRDHEQRIAFASTKIVPGGWDGLAAGARTAAYDDLVGWETRLADLIQSAAFFKAVSDHIRSDPDSFEIAER